jgi:hypothetical protein
MEVSNMTPSAGFGRWRSSLLQLRLSTLPGGPFPRPQIIKRPILASIFFRAWPSRFPPAIRSNRSLENHSSIFLSYRRGPAR